MPTTAPKKQGISQDLWTQLSQERERGCSCVRVHVKEMGGRGGESSESERTPGEGLFFYFITATGHHHHLKTTEVKKSTPFSPQNG